MSDVIGDEVSIEGSLDSPDFLHMNKARIEYIFCVTVFHTAVFGSAALDHHPHNRTRIRESIWREADCSDD